MKTIREVRLVYGVDSNTDEIRITENLIFINSSIIFQEKKQKNMDLI